MNKNNDETFRVFVLMPFDSEFDGIYVELIKPAFEEVGFYIERADSIVNQQNILKDIVRGILEADLIIADLTTLNPNVLYELGISHTMQKNVVLIAQSIEDIPFDLRPYRIIPYSVHFSEAPKLIKELRKIGEGLKAKRINFGNPVADFAPKDEISKLRKVYKPKTEVEQEGKEIPEEEKGVWDFASEGEASLSEIKECTERITEALEEITGILNRRTQEATEIQKDDKKGKASRMFKLAKLTAEDIVAHAKKLGEEQPKLHKAWEMFIENTSGLISFISANKPEVKKELIQFRETIEDMRLANSKAIDGVVEYQGSVSGMKGISKDINRASDRLVKVLDLIISDLRIADSYCMKAVTLIDEKIGQED